MGDFRVAQRMGLLRRDVMSSGSTTSQGCAMDGRPILGIILPAMNGTAPELNVEVSPDGGSSWYSLLEDDASTQAIALTGMGTAYAVSSDDLTPLAAYVAMWEGLAMRIRLISSVAQTAERTFDWVVLG